MATPTTLPASFVSGSVLQAAQLNNLRGAFRVLQVVQTVKTDTFTTSSTSFVDVTGMSVSITPSSTSSLVLVLLDSRVGGIGFVKLQRGSTDIYVGDAAGSRVRSLGLFVPNANGEDPAPAIFVDNPATTSSTTYKLQMRTEASSAFLNRSSNDPDNTTSGSRTASSITVMEISA